MNTWRIYQIPIFERLLRRQIKYIRICGRHDSHSKFQTNVIRERIIFDWWF